MIVCHRHRSRVRWILLFHLVDKKTEALVTVTPCRRGHSSVLQPVNVPSYPLDGAPAFGTLRGVEAQCGSPEKGAASYWACPGTR